MPAPQPDRKKPDDLLNDPLLRDAPVVEGFKVLDPAVLYAKIGKGGMGAVYRGRHFKLDLDVAVKCLKPSLVAEDQDFVKRFEREARLAASIAHQNVVRVMDVQEKNGLHYLVMEFVRGETADERVKRKGPLAEKEALAILLGATAGLAEAHQRGIVHRDIKPSNIMVSLEGRVKLADLGLAKSSGAVDGRSMSMASSMIMGTPQYMPPEQWNTTDVTPAADVWALGATLWFLLAAREGIPPGSMMEVGRRIQEHEYPTLRAERADVRKEVHELLERCVHRDPKERFADAKALLKALRKLATDDEDVLLDPETGSGIARAGTVTPPPRETLLRIRAQVETNPTGKAAEAGPDARSAASTKPARRERPVSAARGRMPKLEVPKRGPGRLVVAVGLVLVALLGIGWAAGLFPPGKNAAANEAKNDPPPKPPVSPDPKGSTDPKGDARAAFARGMQALPKPDQLDQAIADFEQALSLDPTMDEAKKQLAVAFGSKAKKAAAADDPDSAYTFVKRGFEHAPGDRALIAQGVELERVLGPRLGNGIAIAEPKRGGVVAARHVVVSGRADAPLLKALRLAVISGNAPRATFPSESRAVQVVAGEFTCDVEVAGDGEWTLVLQAEDDHGLRAQVEGTVVVVDTADPKLVIASPGAGVTVGASCEVRGRVVDATPCKITVNGVAADTSTPGEWSARVTLREGPQQLVVEATDGAGHTGKVTQAVRVDATPPELVLSEVPPLTNQSEVVVRGLAKGLEGGKVTIGLLPLEVDDGGNFTTTLSLPKDDRYTFVLGAVDGVGNKTEWRLEIRRHTKVPVLEWGEPVPGAPVAAGEVSVKGRVLSDLADCKVTVNGAEAVVIADLWRSRVTVEAGKDVPVVVTATDAADNTATALQQTLKGAPKFTDRIDTGIGLAMVFVKPDTFRMGTEGNTGAEKAHTVTITKGYWIGETEVTQKQWRTVMGTEPWKGQDATTQGDDVAATNVSWNDAVAFCEKLNDRERAAGRLPDGYRYALPSEAEWEMACRGGSKAAFCYGDDEDRLGQYAVFGKSYDGGHAERVRQKKANDFGLYDMHGNVWEWCADFANFQGCVVDTDTYRNGVVDPLCVSGSQRVIRGGSWFIDPACCRSANRSCSGPALAGGDLGFRPVLSARSK